MKRAFVQTHEFSKNWDKLGFTDEDLRNLENQIMDNPKRWPIIQGTGKLRKMRFAFHNRGKRDSVRVCYVDFDVLYVVYLITVYAKNEKDDLSDRECNNIRKLIDILEADLVRGKRK
ncbi:MAG: hypothetical protein IJG36_06620 [Synergistaceae bacterium]|nr:hypothetical protein [Synergistaceae bacterium]MBQ4402538.1 hypothetical protein [Synergistaceae bacterium]MBQ6972544.1 hypothetical protein [Synergistaceae bacterium]